MTRKLTPFLWFDGNLEEALNLYVSVFDDTEIHHIQRMGDIGHGTPGSVLTASFRLGSQEFIALNGGPQFKFTEAVSFMIDCKNQVEVDHYWNKLSEGGSTGDCGWLKDRFGLSWQVVPSLLGELLGDPDAEKSNRVMQAMMQMTRMDIAKLQAAYDDVTVKSS